MDAVKTKSSKLDDMFYSFMKSQFDAHPTCDSISIMMSNLTDESRYIFDEESVCVNGIRWDDMIDETLSDVEDKIREAYKKLPDDFEEIKSQLKTIEDKLREKAESNPLNSIWKDYLQEENLIPFEKKIAKLLKKRFPDSFRRDGRIEIVEYLTIEVKRDGTVNYEINC